MSNVAAGRGVDDAPPPGQADADAVAVVRALADSPTLRARRLELLPLEGPAAPFSDVQGREPTSPAELAELVSSIASVGLLQPVLVEELPDGRHRLVAGERRLRALRWGAVHLPENHHFRAVPAVVCPGPLSEEERRRWQCVENLARRAWASGELAAALLFERCATLASKLAAAGVELAEDVSSVDDPVERFRALDRARVRAGLHHLGAPWEEVLGRLGIQMGPDLARQLVRAFASLPRDLSSEMDEAGVALATRLAFLRLDRGARAAGRELWDLVKARGRPDLLGAAVRERLAAPGLDACDALAGAEALHEEANRARAEANRGGSGRHQVVCPDARSEPSPAATLVDRGVVECALAALRRLLAALRAGEALSSFDAGSVALAAEELLDRVGPTGGERVWG